MRIRLFRISAATAVTLAALAAGGCSGSGAPTGTASPSTHGSASSPAGPPARPCPAGLSSTFALSAGRPVTGSRDVSTDLIVCHYAVAGRSRPGRCSGARVSINTGPQAYTDFRRWVDESVQNALHPGSAPLPVAGIGLGADWVPADLTLEAGRTDRWVAVVLTCPTGASGARALATALARTAMTAP